MTEEGRGGQAAAGHRGRGKGGKGERGSGEGGGSLNGVARLLAAEAAGEDLDALLGALEVREMTLRLEGLLGTAK